MRTRAAAYDGIASSASASGSLAVWSEPGGTWAALLKGGNTKPRRIAERCAGGVAALSHNGLWVACSQPAPEEGASQVQVLALSPDLTVSNSAIIGRAGRDGHAVALAAVDRTLFVAWEDGAVGAPAVRLAKLPMATLKSAVFPLEEPALSRPGTNGREPALLAVNGRVYASWSESELTSEGERHRVMLARLGEAARSVRTTRAQPSPMLAADPQGIVLGFRDAAKDDAKPELFVVRVTSDLALAGKPRRLGRANGEGRPVLQLCGKTRAAIAPLEQASELYVAFHSLTEGLGAVEDNHQYYANKREFVLASTLCGDGAITTLLAERSAPSAPSVELLRVDFRCDR